MSPFRTVKNLTKTRDLSRQARRKQAGRSRLSLERLEDRNLMSTIQWVNEGTLTNDSDGFKAVFGSQAATARHVVEAAIKGWQDVIANFNYSDGSDTFSLTVNMDTSLGGHNRGASADFASKVDANHKPMAGTIVLGAGDDGFGAGYFLDPTPFESSEFQGTVINAYAANATSNGPADGLTDLYTLMNLEMTHEMGIIDDPNVQFLRDPNHFLQDANQADAADFGELWTYTGPDVQALLTTDNSGSNSSNSKPLHIAEPDAKNVVTLNNRTYFGVQDVGNPFYEFGRRYLVSDLDALILQDSYGYTINRPLANNMYVVFDQTAGTLLVRGSSAGEDIYPGQSNPSNDAIQINKVGTFSLTSTPVYQVFVTIGNPVPGTSMQRLYESPVLLVLAVHTIVIDPGDGANSVGIGGVFSNTSVFIESHGPDAIFLQSGNGQTIDGPVTLSNDTTTSTLILDATFDPVGRSATVTTSTVSGLTPGLVSFDPSQVSNLTIFGGSGGNQFTVLGTSASMPVTLNTGSGNDTVTVGNPVNGLGNLMLGGLTINGQLGQNTLILDDRANTAATNYAITTSEALRSLDSKQVFYAGITNLVLDAGSGGNDIAILDTPVMATIINAGAGGDFVHAGGSLGGDMARIKGPLTIDGQGNTRFAILDQSSTTAQIFTLTATSITRTGGFTASYNNLQSLSINGGKGGNRFVVSALPAGVPVTLAGGTGSNNVTGSNATNAWTVSGAGSGTLGTGLTFSSMASLAGGTGADTFTLLPGGSLAGSISGGAGTDQISYAALPGPISINLQTRAATLLHAGTAGGFSSIESFVGTASVNDTLIGTNPPVLQPNAIISWTVNGPGAGKSGSVAFSGFENLTGGTGVDVFRFIGAGNLRGRLDGGTGGNWLDYSGLTTPVTVNLQTGTATAVTGKVARIQNVHGGNGGNTLTGGAPSTFPTVVPNNILIGGSGADTLIGGARPSLLIGDKGADSVTGGSGGDILIGDFTSFDTMTAANITALMGILAEWVSTDSYATRFADINTGLGGGLNGTAKLSFGTTVLDDNAADTVTATPSTTLLDWFFRGTGDTLQNVEPGEHINNNTPAAFQNRTVTSPIAEGSLATLSGTITDPDPGDPFTLVVNWGDGSPTQTYTFLPGSNGQRVSVTHRYRDDGAYTIALSWTDPTGPANQATLPINVTNVAPTVHVGGDAKLKVGHTLDRTGSFDDPGTGTWTATVDYGDGSGPQPLRLQGYHFALHHRYRQEGTYQVVVTVTDDDGGIGVGSFTVTVGTPGH
jgi:hypothetical protein